MDVQCTFTQLFIYPGAHLPGAYLLSGAHIPRGSFAQGPIFPGAQLPRGAFTQGNIYPGAHCHMVSFIQRLIFPWAHLSRGFFLPCGLINCCAWNMGGGGGWDGESSDVFYLKVVLAGLLVAYGRSSGSMHSASIYQLLRMSLTCWKKLCK